MNQQATRTPKHKIFSISNDKGEVLGYYYAPSKPSAKAMYNEPLIVEEATSAEIIQIGRDRITVHGMFEDESQGRLQMEPPGTDAED